MSVGAAPSGPFDSLPEGRWPGTNGDAANTGYVNGSAPSTVPELKWRATLPVPIEDEVPLTASAPVVGNGQVYVADRERVYALALLDGAINWESPIISPTQTDAYGAERPKTAAPRIGPDGTVFVGTAGGVVALDPSDGAVLWEKTDMTDVAGPAVTENGLLLQGETSVRGYDRDGTEQFSRDLDRGTELVQPARGTDVAVLATEGGVTALDPRSGDRQYHHEVRIETAPVLTGDTCVLGTDEGLLALSANDGEQKWAYSRGDYQSLRGPVVTEETIYAVEQPPEAGAATFALDRTEDGVQARWCSYVGSGVVTAADDERAFGLLEMDTGPEAVQSIAEFGADRGEVGWAITGGSRSDRWLNPPAVLEGALVVTNRRGRVFAFGGAGT